MWRSQDLSDVEVVVVGDPAVLHAEVTDVVMSQDGESETCRMPLTQVRVRQGGDWTCLAGHAGPRRPYDRRGRTGISGRVHRLHAGTAPGRPSSTTQLLSVTAGAAGSVAEGRTR